MWYNILFLFIIANAYRFANNLHLESLLQYKNKNSRIVLRKHNLVYTQNNITLFERKYQKEGIITLTPAGINGFYMLGIIKYMNEHMDLNNYIFSGASAGAWNGLLLCSYKRDKILKDIEVNDELFSINKFHVLQRFMYTYFSDHYTSSDFNFTKLFIGLTQYRNFKVYTNIYSEFFNLEDCLQCCVASSHIPLITNGLFQVYDDHYAFDGGFSENPYVRNNNEGFMITPNMYHDDINNGLDANKNSRDLFIEGYNDCKKYNNL